MPLSHRHPTSKSTPTLSQAAGLTLGFEKNQDVVLANWTNVELVAGRLIEKTAGRTRALDVPDDGTSCVVHELDAHLGDTTTRTCMSIHISIGAGGGAKIVGYFVPVLPRTRVTLTSLTGALEESIFATYRLLWWVRESIAGS